MFLCDSMDLFGIGIWREWFHQQKRRLDDELMGL